MDLAQRRFLILDCQTTGTSPANGQIIDLAWTIASAADEAPVIESHLIALPDGESLPSITTEITGLKDDDFLQAQSEETVRDLFLRAIEKAKSETETPLVAIIHYAQFEKTFLKVLLGRDDLFETICTSKLAKKIMPSIPNFNIRGVAGFFGMAHQDILRARDHVKATHQIWRGLVEEMAKQGLHTVEDVQSILTAKSPKKDKTAGKKSPTKFEFRITREFRLGLPEKPGIYKMKAKCGKILYVGKATSLFDRVNSYFRGQVGRDKRKLQMLAQTWDLDIRECKSALEAAVYEADEIKKWNPPYNVSLKTGRRSIVFYNRDYSAQSREQTEIFNIGPFSPLNSIEEIRWLIDWQNGGPSGRVFYGMVEDEFIEAGYAVFQQRYPQELETLRSHIALGFHLLRKQRALDAQVIAGEDLATEDLAIEEIANGEVPSEIEELASEEAPPTPDEVADKFERLYMRAAANVERARALTRLLNSDISWIENESAYRLSVRGGVILESATPASVPRTPWHDLGIADYDRMSVLYSEAQKRNAQLSFL